MHSYFKEDDADTYEVVFYVGNGDFVTIETGLSKDQAVELVNKLNGGVIIES